MPLRWVALGQGRLIMSAKNLIDLAPTSSRGWVSRFLLVALLLLPSSGIGDDGIKSPQETFPDLPPQVAEKCAEELRRLTELSITRKTREYRTARERYRRDGCEAW